jgi:hypothetical protein
LTQGDKSIVQHCAIDAVDAREGIDDDVDIGPYAAGARAMKNDPASGDTSWSTRSRV